MLPTPNMTFCFLYCSMFGSILGQIATASYNDGANHGSWALGAKRWTFRIGFSHKRTCYKQAVSHEGLGCWLDVKIEIICYGLHAYIRHFASSLIIVVVPIQDPCSSLGSKQRVSNCNCCAG